MPLPPAPLPSFRYHPDPVDTGSIVAAKDTCRACGQARGYVYVGPVYAEEDLERAFCPWCIANGTAARQFGATFADAAGVGGYGEWDKVPRSAVDEICLRTPGFAAFQKGRWWTHCGDGAEFLGAAGRRELNGRWASAVPTFREALGIDDDAEWQDLLAGLSRDTGATAFLFRCRHCFKFGGYIDST